MNHVIVYQKLILHICRNMCQNNGVRQTFQSYSTEEPNGEKARPTVMVNLNISPRYSDKNKKPVEMRQFTTIATISLKMSPLFNY